MLSKNVLPYPLLICLLGFCCNCGNKEKINQINISIDSVSRAIDYRDKELANEKKSIDSLGSEKENQYTQCKVLKDSADFIMNDSWMATAYIYEFDREPIKLIQEYVDAQTDSIRTNKLHKDIILLTYGAFRHDFIDSIRKQLAHFDQEKELRIAKISTIDNNVQSRQQTMESNIKEVENLKEQKEYLLKQLQILNN